MKLDDIINKMQEASERNQHSMQLHCIDEKAPYIQAVPLGDIHFGDKSANLPRVKETVDWIADHEHARAILMGDLMNCATKSSVGAAVFDESFSGQEQYELMLELLGPIKDKIYGSFIGNHEQRIINTTGYNVTKMLAKQMGHKYYGYGSFIKLNVSGKNYIIYGTHGCSGATLPYTKIKKVLDMSSYIIADVYLYAHVHDIQVHTQEVKRVDMRKRIVERLKKYYILTGGYLNYEDSYAEMKNLRPAKQGSPTIIFGGLEKEIRVIL